MRRLAAWWGRVTLSPREETGRDQLAGVVPPPLREDLIVRESIESNGRVMLVDPQSGRTFVLKRAEFIVVSMFDGVSSADAIAAEATRRLDPERPLSAQTVTQFAARLSGLGIVGGRSTASAGERDGSPQYGRLLSLVRWQPALDAISKPLFSRVIGIPAAVAVIIAVAVEGAAWWGEYLGDLARALSFPWAIAALVLVYAYFPVVVAFHELGHVLAIVRLSGVVCPVRIRPARLRVGVAAQAGLIWQQEPGKRVVIALGGLYFQLILLASWGLLWHVVRPLPWATMVLIPASIPLIGGLLPNLLPALPGLPGRRSDGYFTLSYALITPNLSNRSRVVRRAMLRRVRGEPNQDASPPPRPILQLYSLVGDWISLALLAVCMLVIVRWFVVTLPVTGAYAAAVVTFWLSSPYIARLLTVLRRPR